MTTKTTKKTKLEEMAEAGVHFGHAFSKKNPHMDPYIEGAKGAVHIIDLKITEKKLKEVSERLEQLKKENKVIMFVCTKPEFKGIVEEVAKECGMPYVVNRFLGGMITNFKIIKKRIDYYNKILEQQKSGELERKYTKQERVKISKEMEGLERKFGGLRKLEKIPDALFVVDAVKDNLAVKEARMTNIEVIGIADTNSDPTKLDQFIPANDDSISSVKYILEQVKKSLK
ncbi:MAG: 30S ribosomal protein S2 [Patescibacteria group bacterium]|nr:30S ribosomal protein S2 [Patescibacteria group bacterium]